MSAPALLWEPYRKRPSVPRDLSWVDRSKPKPATDTEVEAAARAALLHLGGADLEAMLFGPLRSGRA